ncbi:MAG: FapA family protein [Kyrpidia sp.]|nr:FapA family protein [Kyrpidia sp.]
MGDQREVNVEEVLEVEVAEGGLVARARWRPGTPADARAALDAPAVERVLAASGIRFGIRPEAVARLLSDGESGEWVEVARGVPADPGEAGRIQWLAGGTEEDKRRSDRAETDRDMRVDLRDRGGIRSVSPGTALLRLVPPVPGRDGVSVTGARIAAPSPRPAMVILGPRVEWNEDHSEVLARVAGHPVYDERRRRVDVSPVYRIGGNVDYGVGHVTFEGSLHVGGTIQAGFRVKATGDIAVDGAVDGGIVESGANLEVGAGIYGGTRGEVRAGGSVKAKFIQQARVFADLDVVAARSILHSETTAGRDILVLSPGGTIAGGTCTAVHHVRTAILGSPMAVPTTVAVGLPQSIRERWRLLQDELHRLESLRSKLNLAAQVLEKRTRDRRDSGAMAMKQKVRNDLSHIEERIQEVQIGIQQAAEDMRQFQEAGVWAQKVYPGVKIVIGNAVCVVAEEMERVRFGLEHGEIRVSPAV